MSTRTAPSTSTGSRAAGAFGLASVVLMIGGLVITGGGALMQDGTAGIEQADRDGNLTAILGGWFVQALGFILLLPTAVHLAGSLGRSTPTGRWAAQTGLVLAGAYVAITLAVGLPAGAAAAYGVQHGLDVDSAAALNSMRFFGFLLSLLCLGAYVLCLATSALADAFSPRFIGGFGLVTGVSLMVAAPLAVLSLSDLPTLLYLVWWVGLCVLLLRGRPAMRETGAEHTMAVDAELRQA